MIDQFPALVVVLPILFSLIYLAFFKKHKADLFIVLFHLLMGFILFVYYPHIATNAHVSYAFGGWMPPYGIEFVVNKSNYLFLCLMYFVSFLIALFSYKRLDHFICKSFNNIFFAIYLILLAGFTGILLTNDIFNLYVFIEMSAIATYSLASISNKKLAIKSSLDYLILGTFAATLILLGIGFIYADVGTLNISHISEILSQKQSTDFISCIGFFFIVTGLAIKFALFPFHRWLLNIYAYSSYYITFFYSAISTKIMIFTLYKMQVAFFQSGLLSYIGVDKILLVLSLVSIILGSILALVQKDLRRMLSYSSISQIGYMVIAIILFPLDSYVLMALFISHALAKMTLFMFVSVTPNHMLSEERVSHVTILALLTYVIAAASMIGVPGTYGFSAKVYLLEKLFIQDNYLIFAVMIFAGILSVFYFFRFFEFFYQGLKQNDNESHSIVINLKQQIVFLIMICSLIVLALFESNMQEFIRI